MVSSIEVIFRKGGPHNHGLSVTGRDGARKEVQLPESGTLLPECIIQYVTEDAFGLIGPLRMIASGIDPEDAAAGFAKAKTSILCKALRIQLEGVATNGLGFNEDIKAMCSKLRMPQIQVERSTFEDAIFRLRKLDLLIKKMRSGATLTLSLKN